MLFLFRRVITTGAPLPVPQIYLYEVLVKLYRLPEVLLRITSDKKDGTLMDLPVLEP